MQLSVVINLEYNCIRESVVYSSDPSPILIISNAKVERSSGSERSSLTLLEDPNNTHRGATQRLSTEMTSQAVQIV